MNTYERERERERERRKYKSNKYKVLSFLRATAFEYIMGSLRINKKVIRVQSTFVIFYPRQFVLNKLKAALFIIEGGRISKPVLQHPFPLRKGYPTFPIPATTCKKILEEPKSLPKLPIKDDNEDLIGGSTIRL